MVRVAGRQIIIPNPTQRLLFGIARAHP